jgi:hypothetical protein
MRRLAACLDYLSEQGATLAGFDVTGLPVHPGVSSRAKSEPGTKT